MPLTGFPHCPICNKPCHYDSMPTDGYYFTCKEHGGWNVGELEQAPTGKLYPRCCNCNCDMKFNRKTLVWTCPSCNMQSTITEMEKWEINKITED